MIDISSHAIFNRHTSTLKETSKDKHDTGVASYLTESTQVAVSFDDVKTEYVKNLGLSESPMSCDALFVKPNGELAVIEFKAGKIDQGKQFEIRKKIYDSALILGDIAGVGISQMRQDVEFILVYRESANIGNTDEEFQKKAQASPGFSAFAKGVSKLAKQEYICFGLRRFENYCFKKVHTYSEDEFEEYLSKHTSN